MSSDRSTLTTDAFDPAYETTRVTDDAAFLRKLRKKRTLYRYVGEVYVGKRVKLSYFRQWLEEIKLPPAPNVLEVGSGDGVFAFAISAEHPEAQVVGMELNPVEARACQRVAEDEGLNNLKFVPGLLSDHDWRDKYDFVYCLDVLEHIKDDVAALKEMRSAMKPGASLLVHVPNRYFLDLKNQMQTVPDDEAWRINPGHVRNGYTSDELRDVLERAGLDVLEVRQTQGRPIAKAHRLYNRFERPSVARIMILPLIDRLTREDQKREWTHGNTVWALARRPIKD